MTAEIRPVGYPWLPAGRSDIDLPGRKRIQGYYRDEARNCNEGPRLICLLPELGYTTASTKTLSPKGISRIPTCFFWLKLKLTIYPFFK